MSEQKRRINTIGKLMIDGSLEDYHEIMFKHVEEFYKHFYKELCKCRPRLERVELKKYFNGGV